jgi:hypothetical protein
VVENHNNNNNNNNKNHGTKKSNRSIINRSSSPSSSAANNNNTAAVSTVTSASLDTSQMTTASLPHPATAVRPRSASSPGRGAVVSTTGGTATATATAATTGAGTSVTVHKTTPSLSQYSTNVPITKHYEINSQILAAFESSYDARRYHVAYAIGMQFVETALLEIPKHGYFYSPRHERERMQSSLDAVRVATLLQDIQQQAWSAESQEDGRAGGFRLHEYEKMQKLKALAVEQVERASEDQYEAQRAKAEREIRSPNKSTTLAAPSFSSPSRQQQQQPLRQPLSSSSSSAIYNNEKAADGSNFKNKTRVFRNLFGRRGGNNNNNKNDSKYKSGSSNNVSSDTAMSSSNKSSDNDSADSWIVLDGWIGCPESLTNVLCPQTTSHTPLPQPATTSSPTQVVLPLPPPPSMVSLLPPPQPPPPPLSSLRPFSEEVEEKVPTIRKQQQELSPNIRKKDIVKKTKKSSMKAPPPEQQQQRESALSTMPTLAVTMPLEQRSRTAPPGGGLARKPTSTTTLPQAPPPPLPLPQPPLQRQDFRETTTTTTTMDHHRKDDDPYQQQQDQEHQNQQILLSRDWQLVNGEGAIPLTQHLRQHSADEILLERALYLSGLEIAPAPPPPPPPATLRAKTMAAAGAPYSPQQQQQHHHHPPYYGSIPEEDEIMTGGDVLAVTSPVMVDGTKMMTNKRLELATLKQLYHEDFDQLRREGRIQVAFADTFQGRLTESTNGCTVIAPLLCMHHLLEDDDHYGGGGYGGSSGGGDGDVRIIPDPGLPDNGIIQVIDKETPVILNELRTSLGLSEQAFLIPADVHDYLIENGQLHQSQFVNVVGGNILDEAHLQNLFQALEEDNVPVQQPVNSSNGDCRQGNKLAATLFFHEHVVAILKLRREPPANNSSLLSSAPMQNLLSPHAPPHSPATISSRPDNKGSRSSEFWYDLIDSLPLKETLTRVDESDVDFSRRLGLSDSDEELSQAFLPMTARIRCLDAESMRMCIRWYACSKFTPENCQFIDTYEWDDAQSDFDPRVFQAFIWGSA